ncbi:polymorphic membrane protein [Breznakia blatticola]|uniref:Polymorphic membrane protein n=2 Tax=Breznakia blatticola TaxID=1754012 RepID=A0A4V6Q8L3_9FIRM|nr:polymorphic membrane protein [Breznakia blatticola]
MSTMKFLVRKQIHEKLRLLLVMMVGVSMLTGFAYTTPKLQTQEKQNVLGVTTNVATYDELKAAIDAGAQSIAITSNDMFKHPMKDTLVINHKVVITNASNLNITLKVSEGKRHFSVTKNGDLSIVDTSGHTITLTGQANEANPSSYSGGIYVGGGKLTLSNVTFNQTVAKLGGAIEAYDNAQIVLDAVTFNLTKAMTASAAGGHGSVMYYDNSKSNQELLAGTYNVHITNSKVNTPAATFNGAFFFKDVTVAIDTLQVSRVATSGNGGAFYIDNSNLDRTNAGVPQIDAKNLTITSSSSSLSGGDFHILNASVSIDNLKTTDAHASGSGGSIYAKGADVFVQNSTFIDNKSTHMAPALGFKGGAMMIVDSNFYIQDSKLESELTSRDLSANTENATYGGGIYITGATVFEASNVSVDGGQAEFGGAMYIDSATSIRISGASSFTNNHATTEYSSNTSAGDGGAIYINPEIEENGALVNMYERMHIDADTIFQGNSADVLFIPNNAIEKYDAYIPMKVQGVSPDLHSAEPDYQQSPLNSYDINFDEKAQEPTTGTIIVKYHGQNPTFFEATKSQVFVYNLADGLPTIPLKNNEEIGFTFTYSTFVKYVLRVNNDITQQGIDITDDDMHGFDLKQLPQGVILQDIGNNTKVLHIDAIWENDPVVDTHTVTIAEVTNSTTPALVDKAYTVQVYIQDDEGHPLTGYVTLSDGTNVLADANGMISFQLGSKDAPITIVDIPEGYKVKVAEVLLEGYDVSYTVNDGSGEHAYDASFYPVTSDLVIHITNTVERDTNEPTPPKPVDPLEPTPPSDGTQTPEVPKGSDTSPDDGDGPITGMKANDPIYLVILILSGAGLFGMYKLIREGRKHNS